jgi:hypothetical protein
MEGSAQCIKWGFEGCLVGEFRGLTFDKDVENLVSKPLGPAAAAAAAPSPPAGIWWRLAGAVEVRVRTVACATHSPAQLSVTRSVQARGCFLTAVRRRLTTTRVAACEPTGAWAVRREDGAGAGGTDVHGHG